MNDPKLGRLEDVVLREVWKDEARDFTPWLARPENLELLENTLGLGLEADTVETEKDVGPFRADILCQETGSDRWVLIENQLGGTDHIHLGQLLTYAAGRRAMTVVWIAKSFTDEHRAALDWLNEITDEKLRFFGLEIELWSIGGSLPAPKFNVVSKPNNWSRKIKREEGSGAREETRKMRRAYWEALNKTLNDAGGPIHGNRTPQPEGWMRYYTVRRVFHVQARISYQKKLIATELNIEGPDAAEFFNLLELQREEIEQDAEFSLLWLPQPDTQNCRIEHSHYDVDPSDEEDWPQQHKWLADRLNAMHRVFSPRIPNLVLEDLPDDEDE